MADPQTSSDPSADEYLQSVLQGAPAPSDAAPPPMAAPQAAPDPAAPTPVAGVDVVAPKNPGINFQSSDSVQDAQNVRAALQNPAFQPQGGGANPGVWGLLPQSMQHGTLRNVLGALGDAFLVGSGHQAQYEPRMERQQEGLAMSDYSDHPEIAAARVAATGTPGAAALSDQMTKNTQQHDLQMQVQEQNNAYRQSSIDARTANNASLAQNRTDSQVRQSAPQMTGYLNQATDAADYARRYAIAEQRAQSIGPSYHADTDFGAIAPADWKPGMQQGLTAGQQQLSADKGAARTATGQNVAARNTTSLQVAGINAGQRATSSANTQGAYDTRILKQAGDSGMASLSPTDQARVTYLTTHGTKGAAPTLTPAAGAAAGNGPPPGGKLTPAQGRALPKGTTFQGTDGKWYKN